MGKARRTRFGTDILDGIGSTEMLHSFISNRHGDPRYGTTGKPRPRRSAAPARTSSGGPSPWCAVSSVPSMVTSVGSFCAVHPTVGAEFTCARCGSFGCDACRATGQRGLCIACERRLPERAGEGVTATELLGETFGLVFRNKWELGQLALVSALVTVALGWASGLVGEDVAANVAFGVVGIATTTIFEAAWIALLAAAATGEESNVLAALRIGVVRVLPLFVCNFFFAVSVGLGTLACLVPGLMIALGWSVAAPEVVVAGSGPVEGLARSWQLTSGHRGHLLVAFLGVFLVLVVAAAGVLLFQFQTGIALKPIPLQMLSSLLGAPMVALPVVAWLRLTGRGQSGAPA